MVSQSEWLATGYFSGIALVLAILAIVGLGLMLHVDRLIGRWVAFGVVPAMGLGIAISSLFSGRDLKYAFANIEAISVGAEQGGTSILRIVTLAVIATCAATVVSRLFDKKSRIDPKPGQVLLLAFFGYYLCNGLLNAIFGTFPSFTHHVLYVPVALAAVYMWRGESIETFISAAKWMLVAFMVSSLVAAVLIPGVALQPGYKGWIPGFSSRLWGVGSNPNSIGPMAIVLALLAVMVPSRNRVLQWTVLALAGVVLLLAQSKTAWAAAAAVAPVVAWYRFGRAPGGGTRIGFVLGLIVALLILALGLAFVDLGRLWNKLAAGQIGSDVSTLTGRLQIWSAAIDAWRENPTFGYGPTAWGPLHRATIGLPFAFSAHNQFLQSLSVAGSLGLISLLVYLGVLGVYCLRAAVATKGVSLALFLMVFLRCFTEAPFSAVTLFNGDMLTQVLLFRLALSGALVNPKARIVPVRQFGHTVPG